MRLMMLGASLAQLPGILAARAMGHEVVTCDDRPDSIGHRYGTHHAHASTFLPEDVLAQARHFAVNGIMTMGTDQPVLTAALVANKLGLPSLLDVETARAVTDKRVMKRLFDRCGIPAVPWTLYRRGGCSGPVPLRELTLPLVVKPVDSQGQRGIFLLSCHDEVPAHLDRVLAWSRADEILVESYYPGCSKVPFPDGQDPSGEHGGYRPNSEVTVSGWVCHGVARVLSITDRVTFPEPDRLGVCIAHELPSRHLSRYGQALCDMTQAIVSGFDIREGPLYFQFLLGAEGIRVNEVACRIGGAFESQFLPRVTGFDLTGVQIRSVLGEPVSESQWTALQEFDVFAPGPAVSVQLFFAEPCTISELTPISLVKACPGVMDAGYHVQVGQVIHSVRDATTRVGYCVVEAPDRTILEERLRTLYAMLFVRDAEGNNRIVHRPVGAAWNGGNREA